MLTYLLQGLLLGLPAAFTPGPLQAFFLAQTLKHGWRRTLPAAFAPLLSDGPIIALTLFVLTQTPAWLLSLLQMIGGLFLLYLAWGAFNSTRQPAAGIAIGIEEEGGSRTAPTQANGWQSFLKAALMNLLSPGPYIFWSTIIGPVFLNGWRSSSAHGLAFLLGFYGALISGFVAIILLFGLTGRLDPRLNRALVTFSAVALALFGLYQLVTGIASFFPRLP